MNSDELHDAVLVSQRYIVSKPLRIEWLIHYLELKLQISLGFLLKYHYTFGFPWCLQGDWSCQLQVEAPESGLHLLCKTSF